MVRQRKQKITPKLTGLAIENEDLQGVFDAEDNPQLPDSAPVSEGEEISPKDDLKPVEVRVYLSESEDSNDGHVHF